jgi:hypothetical protein
MTTRKMSDNQIAITIVPRRALWPEANTANVWASAHRCVDGWHSLIRQTDLACSKAEQDSELNTGAIGRRRSEICDQALRKLVNFRGLEIAEKALTENIDALERLSHRDPEQAQMLQKLKQALTDLREGIPATERMLEERKARKRVFA